MQPIGKVKRSKPVTPPAVSSWIVGDGALRSLGQLTTVGSLRSATATHRRRTSVTAPLPALRGRPLPGGERWHNAEDSLLLGRTTSLSGGRDLARPGREFPAEYTTRQTAQSGPA